MHDTRETECTPLISFGRELCGDLASAESREWLVTNGLGGFASGTVGGQLTRRYHGLLIAALNPPAGRTLLVPKFDEVVEYDGRPYPLATNHWRSGVIEPQGYRRIEEFHLEGMSPVWTYACGDALLSKKVWMEKGANTTYVRYRLERAGESATLSIKALVNYRDFHSLTRAGTWQMEISQVERGLCINAFYGATPFYVVSSSGSVNLFHQWYRAFELSAEAFRGMNHQEDHLHAGTFEVELKAGESALMVVSTDARPHLDERSALDRLDEDRKTVMGQFGDVHRGVPIPDWIDQLALAADQFIVKRKVKDTDEYTVIAGYHWFSDWGRDTMVALPGLTLVTGRPEVARSILLAWSGFVDGGMLPNRFMESGEKPDYNTADAALWYFNAVRSYWSHTRDKEFLKQIFPVLCDIIAAHMRGTRYNIHLDRSDGLLYAGQQGLQLTWMDAKVGNQVVTPRIGKPIEINALWLNALAAMKEFADELGSPADDFQQAVQDATKGFERFWNDSKGYCFDVLDGPAGNDSSLRPNQIFTVALPESPFEPERQRTIVDAVSRYLQASPGLRTLAPDDPQYKGTYAGNQEDRDGAYHQGTVWGWLLGPFVKAHLRVHNDPSAAASFLAPVAHQIHAQGLGTVGEIYDADPPFLPRGCIAQAWTVGGILEAWEKTAMHDLPVGK
ncbi:MAG: glycogen debranching protein [Acidobacteria bacterium]|nr:MAG: glycogen debranching protein [Acidobacteriota bacterium]